MDVETYISWPTDCKDLKFERAVNVLPIELVHFLIVLLGFSDKILFSEKIQIREEHEKKFVAIAQDLIHAFTSKKTMTSKAVVVSVLSKSFPGIK